MSPLGKAITGGLVKIKATGELAKITVSPGPDVNGIRLIISGGSTAPQGDGISSTSRRPTWNATLVPGAARRLVAGRVFSLQVPTVPDRHLAGY